MSNIIDILNIIKSIFSKKKPAETPKTEERAAKISTPKSSTVRLFASPIYQAVDNIALYRMYQDVQPVKALVNKIKDKYVSVPYLVQNKSGKTIENHYIRNLVTTKLLEEMFMEQLILGNTFANISKSTKNFVEFIEKLPGIFTIAIIQNPNDLISAKIIKYEIIAGTKRTFEEKDVFHFKTAVLQNSTTYNPYGEALLMSARKSVTVLAAIYDSLITIFNKRGAVGILASKNAELPIEDSDAILNSFYNKYGYGEDKHGIMVTTAAVEYIKMGLPVSELTPIEIKDSEFRELCKLFNISSVLFSDNLSSTYNNFQTASTTFINDNVKPFLINFYSELSKKIDADFVLVPDFSELNESMKDIKLFNEVYSLMYNSGVVTGNEWRQINNLPVETQYNGNKQLTATNADRTAV